MRLTLEDCLELCPVLEELDCLWFEELVGSISREWIDRGAYQIVQPDCNVTGIGEGWHIARMAALKDMPCCPHNWHGGLTTMANAALVAGIPNRLLLEPNQTWNPFKEELFEDPLVVRKGYMDLPKRPGFGMRVKRGVAAKFPFIPGNYWKPNPKLV